MATGGGDILVVPELPISGKLREIPFRPTREGITVKSPTLCRFPDQKSLLMRESFHRHRGGHAVILDRQFQTLKMDLNSNDRVSLTALKRTHAGINNLRNNHSVYK